VTPDVLIVAGPKFSDDKEVNGADDISLNMKNKANINSFNLKD